MDTAFQSSVSIAHIKQGPAAALPAIIIDGSSVTTYTYTPAITTAPEPRSTTVLLLLFGFGFAMARRATGSG